MSSHNFSAFTAKSPALQSEMARALQMESAGGEVEGLIGQDGQKSKSGLYGASGEDFALKPKKRKVRLDRSDLRANIEAGMTVDEIAKFHSVRRSWVRQLARDIGCKFQEPVFDDATFAKMWNDGVKARDIAEAMRVSESTVSAYSRRLGLARRTCDIRSKTDLRLMMKMSEDGVARDRIASHFGVTPEYIRRKIRSIKTGELVLDAPQKAEAPKPEIKAPKMPFHPYWTPELDLRVMITNGKYDAVSKLAKNLGRSIGYVLQRWHQMRAAR